MLKLFRKRTGSAAADLGGKSGASVKGSKGPDESIGGPLEQLREAVEANNVLQVKRVLSAWPSTSSAPFEDLGTTCIHLAATMGNVECLELLLKHGDVNVVDSNGQTALHCSVDHPDVVMLLLKKSSLDVNRLAHNRQSLLHIMAKKYAPIDDKMWAVLRKVCDTSPPVLFCSFYPSVDTQCALTLATWSNCISAYFWLISCEAKVTPRSQIASEAYQQPKNFAGGFRGRA